MYKIIWTALHGATDVTADSCFMTHLHLSAVLFLFITLLIYFFLRAALSSPLRASTEWQWFEQFVPLCPQMGKSTECIKLSLWEPNYDTLSDPLSAETVHILLSLARHASIYQQNHSLLFEVWPPFHILHFQNPYFVFFSSPIKACFTIPPP